MINQKKTIILFCASIIMILSFGPRSSLGVFMQPVSLELGWPVSIFALSLATQNLIWGIFQPIMGGLADRFGAKLILSIGAVLYSIGIYSLSISTSIIQLVGSFGIVAGIGLSAASLTIVISAISKFLPSDQRSFAIGIITAAGSLGQLLVTPLSQHLINSYSWRTAIITLSFLIILIPIFSIGFSHEKRQDHTETKNLNLSTILSAFDNKNYLFLLLGFFVCGFHVAFITSHLPSYLVNLNITSKVAAMAIGLIGFFNIFGCLFAGMLGARYAKADLLSLLYLSRALCILCFFIFPKTEISVYIFASTIGLLWLSTVPLTSGLVGDIFGVKNIGSLFGFVFLAHQLGAFCGVLLGGLIYDYFGDYNLIWKLSILLGLLAAAVHLPIKIKETSGTILLK